MNAASCCGKGFSALLGVLLGCTISLAVPLLEMDPAVGTRLERPLEAALGHLNAGRYDQAVNETRNYLKNHPNSPAGQEILGAALAKKGDLQGGLAALELAVKLAPGQSSAITKMGDIYLALGEDGKAKECFLRSVKVSTGERRAHQRLGLLYDKEGEHDLAIEHYEKGLIGTPKDYLGIKVELARLYNDKGRWADALALLEPLVKPDFPGVLPHLVLGSSYLGLEKHTEALRQFRIARDLEPESERGFVSLGIAYRAAGKLQESRKTLEEFLKLKPDAVAGHFQLGETLLAQGQEEKALGSYRRAEALNPSHKLIQSRLAAVDLKQGHLPEAIVRYEKLIKEGGTDSQILDALASAYQLNGQFSLAEKTFQELVTRNPESAFAHYRLGMFWGFQKKYEQAIASLEKAFALAPANPSIVKALSLAYHQSGRIAKAVETAKKLLDLKSNDLNELFYLASLEQDAGNKREAIRLLKEITDKNSTHAAALNNLAVLLADQGEFKEATRLAEKSVSVSPENGVLLDTLGWIYHRQGKNTLAKTTLEKAAFLSPGNPVILFHLGVVHKNDGNRTEAKKNLEKALSLRKEFQQAEEAKAILKQIANQ